MREPTKEEMVEGIAKGFCQYLKDKDYGPSYLKPLANIDRAFREEFATFLAHNRDQIIDTIGKAR